MLSLLWKEVNIEARTLTRIAQKSGREIEVPLNAEAMRVILAWRGMRRNEWVFYNPETGEPWKDLWLGLKKACRKAGLKGITWHTFRHTFASRLIKHGTDLVAVKELLGHAEMGVTMRYAHTSREAKEQAVGKLSGKSDNLEAVVDNSKKSA